MAKLSIYALAGALAFALAPVAGFAADLPEPPLLEPAPGPVEFGSAWYLRGDIGYKSYRNPKATYTDSAYAGAPNFNGEKMKEAAIFGGGVGYKISDHFRTDVTLDYETPAKFHGDLPSISPCGVRGNCGSSDHARISSLALFWNGYVDIATIGGFTPYVGGGIGVARLDVTKYGFSPYGKCPAVTCPSGNYKGDDAWNFAWNVQAGAGYAITDNLLFDANYRFVDLGDAKTRLITSGNNKDGKVRIKDIQAHEVRLGFRYMID